MYEPFEAEVWDTIRDTSDIDPAHVQPHDSGTKCGMVMEIVACDINIYITKAQAMEFFGLVDPGDDPKWDI